MKIQPPEYNHEDSANSIYSLHRYKPMAFIAETTWERLAMKCWESIIKTYLTKFKSVPKEPARYAHLLFRLLDLPISQIDQQSTRYAE